MSADEPHSLPLTRKWLEDLGRFTERPPDLQELVATWGGFDRVPGQAWDAFDHALADWQRRRCER